MIIRTGIYVRVSTDDQRDNGFSIDSQLRMLKEHCEKNNYDIIGVYDDGGYSGKSIRKIAHILNKEHAYLNTSSCIWYGSRVELILKNKIYIGIFEFGKTKRKEEDILTVEDYCEPIVDMNTWNATRRALKKNKHANFEENANNFDVLKMTFDKELHFVSSELVN